MANYSWATLEDAVVAALRTELSPQVPTLETYQGNWPVDLQRETWRFPAVLVMLRQTRGAQVALRSYEMTLEFTILVIARQLRGEAARRRAEGGVYQILEGVRKALWYQDLGLELSPFDLLKEEPLLNDQEFSVYAAHYGTGLVQDF